MLSHRLFDSSDLASEMAPGLVKMLATTKPTATKSIELLEKLGIVEDPTGRKRDRTYHYSRYLEQLRTGIELTGAGRRTST